MFPEERSTSFSLRTQPSAHRRHLLADRGWEAASVTAVAFNKRAADELVARTAGLGAHVRTINALGLAVSILTSLFRLQILSLIVVLLIAYVHLQVKPNYRET